MRTRHLIPALVATGLLLGACSGGSDSSDEAQKGGDGLSGRLSDAKTALDDAETISIKLATKRVPDGITGLLSAEGKGNHSPAFTGKVTVVTGGASLAADVIATAGKVYAKTGFLPTFSPIDPASLKAPDPAMLLDRDNGITQILVKTQDLKQGDKSRDGKDVLTTITGTLPGSVVRTIIPSANAGKPFTVAYRVDDDDNLRDVTLTGPFYPGVDEVTYTVVLSTSKTPVTIEAP
ncbi:LppX_LprAFG lipoprotein [Aeromicrobium wangtongii]|uniref:LppX_LprAFG lipoprotein n=1 Tax=Aeromicrobium wangtongii TaxID=2969247 RepID=UPI002016BA78|nr:LppX_LprAFG lipoprotein [Aeromicrobium wangtongii]MCL3818562.1 LppX_LprAFG lipoprotein [Aeromicrobium wangtongii]